MTVGTRIQLRRDTAANWTANNPVLAAGEPGFEKDTNKLKIGDGSSAWTSLSYWPGGATSANLLSTGGWPGFESGVAGMNSDSGTVAQSTAQAHGGTHSALVTATSAGGLNLYANTSYPWDGLVTAGNTYTFSFWSRATTAARSIHGSLSWYNASHALISSVNGSTVVNSTSSWSQAIVSGAAPALATAVLCIAQIDSVLNTEQHYIDDGSLTNAT